MKQNKYPKIKVIDEKSPYLETVIDLGDANNATLGFFPREAFIQSAAKRQIIVALNSHKNCIGYLLYYTRSRDHYIKLVHLCLDPSVRGQGIAKKLVEYLKKDTQDYNGITLTCRDDYNLPDMWATFGFVSKSSKPAKTPGKTNTDWYLDYRKPTLLSALASKHRENKLSVAIDYSIFGTLTKKDPDEEAASLLAEWLESEVELCVTEEIFNQIYQIDNLEERNRQQQLVDDFTCLPCPHDTFEYAFQSLKIFCQNKKININESDVRSIARAIAAKIYILVTKNQELINNANLLYHVSKVSIFSPDTLILLLLDSLNQKPDYQPARLAGTHLEATIIQKGEESNLIDAFSLSGQEDKAEFFQRLRRFITEKDKFSHILVKNAEKQPLALIVYDTHKPHELEIPLIRVGDHSLSATLARHLIFRAISKAAFDNLQFTRITDPHLDDSIKNAIEEENMFITVQDGYLKMNLAQAETASILSKQVISLVSNYMEPNNGLKIFYKYAEHLNSLEPSDFKNLLALEKLLWPAKITDANIPTFIIPIQPKWAKELFDNYLSQQCLFSNNTDLALNREAVYYKKLKPSPKKLKPGMVGRILWYVSGSSDKDKGFIEIQAVRACSILDEVVIGTPEELDLRFRNLGVYKKEDLLKIANGDENQDIMAVKFSTTELFDRPIFLTNIRKILNNKTTIQNAIEITDQQFEQIYNMGYA